MATMTVIIDGVERQRHIDHNVPKSRLYIPPLIAVPMLNQDEMALYTIDGICHIVKRVSLNDGSLPEPYGEM